MAWGKKLGQSLEGGQLIEFVGDLGGGKTTIIKGIANGLGVTKTVTSPTFSVMRRYELPNGHFFDHYDLYRVGDDDVVARELQEASAQPDTITVVEWSRPFVDEIKADFLRITIKIVGDNERMIELEAVGQKSQKIVEAMR